MPLNTIINTALSTLLKDGAITDFLVDKSGNKAISIFQQYFTFSTFEITKSYQDSYNYALAAIGSGVAKDGAGTIENCDLRDNVKGAWYIQSGCQVRRSGNKE